MKWNLGSLVFSSMHPCSQPKKIYLSHLSHFLGLFVVQREVCDANIVRQAEYAIPLLDGDTDENPSGST